MQPNKTLSRATINAAAHIVLSSITLIGDFLEKTRRYRDRLHNSDSASLMSNSWQKMGWVLFKKEELITLRNTLHLKLSNINVLLATAQLLVALKPCLQPWNCTNFGIVMGKFQITFYSIKPISLRTRPLSQLMTAWKSRSTPLNWVLYLSKRSMLRGEYYRHK